METQETVKVMLEVKDSPGVHVNPDAPNSWSLYSEG